MQGDEPSRPLANLTCVGLRMARKALKNWPQSERMRSARATPRPRPTTEPMVMCVESLLAEKSRVSRSDVIRISKPALYLLWMLDPGRIEARQLVVETSGHTHVEGAVLPASSDLSVVLLEKGQENLKT